MFKIDTSVDKPDIQYMYKRALKLMEDGIRVGDLDGLYDRYYKIQQDIGNEMRQDYGIDNANSGAQIIRYMQSLYNEEVYEVCCIEDKWTTNKDALAELAVLGHKFAEDLLYYRKAKKYAESIKSMIKAKNPNDGLVHPTVTLGKTNRINYTEPAIMNIPKNILWHTIVPKKDGNVLYSIDIKNQEPSILINTLKIESLKSALVDPRGLYKSLFDRPFSQKTKLYVYVTNNEERRVVTSKEMAENASIPPVYYTPLKTSVDSLYYKGEKVKLMEVCNTITTLGEQPILPREVYIETVSGKAYKVPVVWDNIKDKQLSKTGILEVDGLLVGLDIRCEGIILKEFKQSWNAMTYGASVFGVKAMCKHIDGGIVHKYFSTIPEFKKYKAMCTDLANNGVQYINTVFGTRLYANESDPKRLKRVLMDLPIQGTGVDILSMLIKHFEEEIISRRIVDNLEIYYTRHDELIIECDGNWHKDVGNEEVTNVLRDILEHQIDDWTPFKVEIEEIRPEKIDLLGNKGEDIFDD